MKKLSKLVLSTLLVMACVMAGCEDAEEGAIDGELYDENQNAVENTAIQTGQDMDMEMNKAVAVIHSNDMQIDAWVTFTRVDEGVRVYGEFSGFPNGMHASHVHVYGDCRADDYQSAGPHLQFAGEGSLGPDNPITGNLGEFSANGGGVAVIDTVIQVIEFENLIGRAVMVHAQGNDLTPPPPGQSGARIACGVIGFANAGSTSGGMNHNM